MTLIHIVPRGMNFFDSILARIAEAEAEMEEARTHMWRLMPHDHQDTALEIQAMNRGIVEENGEVKLKLEFDVRKFKPEEVKVKIVGENILQVTAEHEERSETGSQRRSFARQYVLPKGVDITKVHPIMSPDGVLAIEAPAPGLKPSERVIPIDYKGAQTAAVEGQQG